MEAENAEVGERDKDYFTIVMLGRTGQGKSTTGNKLLGIHGDSTVRAACNLKEWTCQSDPYLLKNSSVTKEALAFTTGDGYDGVTKVCQMLSNEDTCIRVLDVKGFEGTCLGEKAYSDIRVIHSFVEVQKQCDVIFNVVLYFLPFRGTMERMDNYLKDELSRLLFYFDYAVFQRMVIVATQHKDYQSYELTSRQLESLNISITEALKRVSQKEDMKCPPIIYIALDMTPENVLHHVRSAASSVSRYTLPIASQAAKTYSGKGTFENNICEAEAAMLERAGSVKNIEDQLICECRLNSRQRKQNEEWLELADSYNTLAKQAYPKKTNDEIEILVKNRILSQVKNQQRFPPDMCLNELLTILMAEDAIPTSYSDEGDETVWESWITNFEKETSQRHLDENEKVKWFKLRISNHLLTAPESDIAIPQCQLSYEAIRQCVEMKVYLRCFEMREKQCNEELQEYANALSDLVEKAYPYQTQLQKCKLVFYRIKSYLHPSIQSKEWNSVTDAVSVNCALNVIKQEFAAGGCNGLDEWLEMFEKKADEYSVNGSTRLLWLESRLAGDALECYSSLSEESKKDYNTTKKAFRIKLYKNSFDKRCNQNDGKLNEIGKELLSLSAGAFPNMLEPERQQLILKYFLPIVSNRGIQLNLTPRTIREAILFISAIEYVPNVFNGLSNWNVWIKNMDGFVRSTKDLNHDEMKRCIQSRLSGVALEMFNWEHKNTELSYEFVMLSYHKKLFTHWVYNRKKSKAETWDSYVQEFISLANRADLDKMESSVLKHLLDQVHDTYRSTQWNSLDQAVKVISAAEEILPFSDENSKDWSAWRKNFECLVNNHDLNYSEKVLCLGGLLRGNAQNVFHHLHANVHGYSSIMDGLTIAMYIAQFKSSKRTMTQSWEMYSIELLSLAKKAYPEREDTEMIVQEHILSQVSELSSSKPWKSLSEVIIALSANEEIPAYANKEDELWEEWIEQFQKVISKHSLENTKKLLWLSHRLVGDARKIFDKMHTEEKIDYNTVVACLGKKFYNSRFESAKRGPNQGLDEYAKHLTLLVQRMNPEMSIKDREQKVLDRILSDISEPLTLEPVISLDNAVCIISTREVITIYTDKEDWAQWKAKFQNAVTKHGLSSKQIVCCLSYLLSGDAKEAFDMLPNKDELYYASIITKLEQNLYMSKFLKRKKRVSETWEALRTELCSLAKNCYPDEISSNLDAIVLRQLYCIIREQNITLCKQPASLDEAILILSVQEAIPSTFPDDKEDWEKWIQKFDSALSEREISDNDTKLKYLQLRLTGRALSLFSTILETQKDYKKVRQQLKEEIYTEKFDNRKRQPDEPWKVFVAELRSIAQMVFPPNECDRKVLDKILSDPSASEIQFSDDFYQWDSWIAKFDQILISCSLDDNAMFKWFHSSLIGEARAMFDNKILSKPETSYTEAKRAMEGEITIFLFHKGERAENESVSALAARFKRYARKVFSSDNVEEMTAKRIIGLLTPDNVRIESLSSVSTLDETVTTFTALECMKYFQYHDGDDWEWWLNIFEKTAARQNLSERERLQWMKACLTGHALKTFNSYFKPSHRTFQSITDNIRVALEERQRIALQQVQSRLNLRRCTKCSGTGGAPMCHTYIVAFTDTLTGIERAINMALEAIFDPQMICAQCRLAIGTEGCTLVGNGAEHNCSD